MMSDKNYLSVYAKSFNWAGFFLPKKTYKKCSALYDFCRVADNIADDEEKLEVKEIKFKQFKKDFVQKNFDNQIVTFLASQAEGCRPPRTPRFKVTSPWV